MKDILVNQQREICQKYRAEFIPTDINDIIGISDNTNGKLIPINGLRHPIIGDTSGWYIWSGEEYSESGDFFKPLHMGHLVDRCPQILKFLGLPPGYRFLIDNKGYEDVWYDRSLLDIDS